MESIEYQEKDWESGEGLSYAEARAAEADARYMRSVTENELTASYTATDTSNNDEAGRQLYYNRPPQEKEGKASWITAQFRF